MLPKEPVMLLSYVNTQLRDFYPNLSDFCEDRGADEEELLGRLQGIGYLYDEKLNRFVQK